MRASPLLLVGRSVAGCLLGLGVAAAGLGVLALPAHAGGILQLIGSYESGIFGKSAAEISAYDPATMRLFVVNGDQRAVDVLDLSDPTNPSKLMSIALGAGSPNSVAVKNGILAIAVQDAVKTNPGTVAFYSAADATFALPTNTVTVGALPDMLTFTPDGTKVLVANEGEPNFYGVGNVDPQGTVSVIDIASGVGSASVSHIDFTSFNGQQATLNSAGVRIFGPGASVAQDLEPEYIAISGDSTKAFVTLQENNALAIIDLTSNQVTSLTSFGLKNHLLAGNALDASDRDNIIKIANWPVSGMYQPDAIGTYEANGQTYLVTANEGDARDYSEAGGVKFNEEARVSSLTLDATAFPNGGTLKQNANLGRLTVTKVIDGAIPAVYDELQVFGARSFSIWDDQGNLVWDSGDQIETLTAALLPPGTFNSNNDANNSFDTRSDNKGPEPEGLAIFKVGNRTYVAIGLERVGGVMLFDITDPLDPIFLDYVNDRNFGTTITSAGHLGAEGLLAIVGADSPDPLKRTLIVVSNEVSGSVDIYAVVPEPATLLLMGAGMGLVGLAAWRRHRRSA